MAVLQDYSMASATHSEFQDWRKDDKSNIRSNAKAERILGISESIGQVAPERKKKKTMFNFSFLSLRTAIPGLSRKSSRCKIEIKTSDSDSIMSTCSPTFDPSTSTTSLNTIDSSPAISKRRIEQFHMNNKAERLSQAETLETKKIHISSAGEETQFNNVLASLNIPSPTLKVEDPVSYSGRRNYSITSRTSSRPELNTKGYRHLQTAGDRVALLPQPDEAVRVSTKTNHPEKHVQDRLESSERRRRPSTPPRSSSLPARRLLLGSTCLPTPQCTDTQPAQVEGENKSATTMPPQWPLPATKINAPTRRLRRIHRSNLMIESVLSLSSDEDDSDREIQHKRRSTQSSVRNSKLSHADRSERVGHKRHESTTSSVIQLDSRPCIRPLSTILRTFPKRSLADIAAEVAHRPSSRDSWETDIVAEMDILSTAPNEETKGLDLLPSPSESSQAFTTHPLWRSSNGSSDIDIRVSRCVPPLKTLREVEPAEPSKLPLAEDEVDVSSFPVPPRSRSASIVPSIQVYTIEETQKSIQPTILEYPEGEVVLLSPSIASRPTSVGFEQSPVSSMSSQGTALPSLSATGKDPVFDFTGRKRASSSPLSYFPVMESPVSDNKTGNADVKSFVFSSIF